MVVPVDTAQGRLNREVRRKWCELVQRPQLEQLAYELRSRGYEPQVEVDRMRGSGWVLRVPTPRLDLPPAVRRDATMTVWCRYPVGSRSADAWNFEWPCLCPFPEHAAGVVGAADFVAEILGPAQSDGSDR